MLRLFIAYETFISEVSSQSAVKASFLAGGPGRPYSAVMGLSILQPDNGTAFLLFLFLLAELFLVVIF